MTCFPGEKKNSSSSNRFLRACIRSPCRCCRQKTFQGNIRKIREVNVSNIIASAGRRVPILLSVHNKVHIFNEAFVTHPPGFPVHYVKQRRRNAAPDVTPLLRLTVLDWDVKHES
jgi:hypothetical protein